jgi:hypothetical protein
MSVATIVLFGVVLYYVGANVIASGLNAVESRAFSSINILLVFALPILGAAFVAVLVKGQYKFAFAATVISFAVLGRTTRLGGITAWDNGEGYAQVIGLTHAMIFSIAFALVIGRRSIRHEFQSKVFIGLVAFATIGTISQLFTHSFPASILLSVGSLWVYVALAYIVFALFEGFRGTRELAAIVVMSLLLGIGLRIATTGQGFFAVTQSEDFYRVDGFAFGPSVSYAGYLAVAAVFAIALAMYESSRFRRLMLLIAATLLVVEVASTGTRGAILSMLLVPVGIAATRRYKLAVQMISLLVLATIVLWPKITTVLDARPIYFDGRINTIPQWLERVELWKLNAPHIFDNFGLGNGIGRQLNLALSNGVYTPSHNTFLDLSQQVGALATLVLLAVIIAVVIRAIKQSLLLGNAQSRTLAVLSLTALFSWLFTANTTSTSLVWFYPVEGTAIFYITLCAIALISGSNTKLTKK